MSNQNVIDEINNSLEKIKVHIDTMIDLTNNFKNQKQLILFSYLLGYFASKQITIFDNLKIIDIFNIIKLINIMQCAMLVR